jgi:ribonuclease P protein component
LIWRIRARSDFSRLAAEGQRARAGVLWCTYLLDPPGTTPALAPTRPRVAFAFGRTLGPAVVRNRLRRQLRAMLQVESSAAALPPGMYLFGARPGAESRSFTELQFDLAQLIRRLHG